MTRWDIHRVPDMSGRTVLITGANSGLGLRTAQALGRAGAHVVLAVRNQHKGDRAAASVPGDPEVRELDLTDLSSVRTFADSWSGELAVLVNNAGVMFPPEGRTADGFELQFGTNHLGHFALTNLLLPHITDRVVTVSSALHRNVRGINWDNPNFEGAYDPQRAYGQSKLANLLFTLELQRKLAAAGSPLRAMAAHPGYAATNLQSRAGNAVLRRLMAVGNRVLAQSDRAGALPTLFAATEDLPGNSYAGPSGPGEMRGGPTLVGRSAAAADPAAAKRLWELSEELTGATFPITAS
ncbi:oxidoreductase [Saccharopolyspora griseoalba]|uniref:Oxidoreductase n=1 Tax=Saccharopolyspora griseoalba TaxID=1431848 RepID=A0ABW2LHA4_9PSEU